MPKNAQDVSDSVIKGIGVTIMAVLFIFGVSVLTGTILWSIYPHIFAMFPTAKNTVLAPTLGWWDAVCITWIFQLLIRSTTQESKKNKD